MSGGPKHKSKQREPKVAPISRAGFYRTFRTMSRTISNRFINHTPLISVGSRAFTIADVVTLAVLGKVNTLLVGTPGTAKTILSQVVMRTVFNDEGFYLRGDLELRLRDLFTKFNMEGKTEAEMRKVAMETIRYLFMLIDEINRVPGILQNQFLNAADGYIEIRGKKYHLGTSDYMLMMATLNPASAESNGDHPGAFEEDLALLDRIPLIIDVDRVPLADGDRYLIGKLSDEKSGIVQGDMQGDVVSCYHYLDTMTRTNNENDPIPHALAILQELVGQAFQFVGIESGGVERQLDKVVEKGWREILPGQTSQGFMRAHCGHISNRTLRNARRLTLAMFEIAQVESTQRYLAGLNDQDDFQSDTQPIAMDALVEAYLNAVKLAMTYRRKFLPDETARALDKPHQEIMDGAFTEVHQQINGSDMQGAACFVTEVAEAIANGDLETARETLEYAEKEMETAEGDMLPRATIGILHRMIEDKEAEQMEDHLMERNGEVDFAFEVYDLTVETDFAAAKRLIDKAAKKGVGGQKIADATIQRLRLLVEQKQSEQHQ